MTKSVKTPWNPSRTATARVKNPLPAPTTCPHCFKEDEHGVRGLPFDEIEIVEHKEIYGRNYGDWPWAYRCCQCEAYVGMHPFTNIPLGTLADGPTRQARKECKKPFESLHKNGLTSRSDAYARLADKLCIPVEQCHFGWFDVDMCRKAGQAAREIFFELHGAKA